MVTSETGSDKEVRATLFHFEPLESVQRVLPGHCRCEVLRYLLVCIQCDVCFVRGCVRGPCWGPAYIYMLLNMQYGSSSMSPLTGSLTRYTTSYRHRITVHSLFVFCRFGLLPCLLVVGVSVTKASDRP